MTVEVLPPTKSSIRVEPVSLKKFKSLKRQYAGFIEVPEGDWVQTVGDIPIINDGASTCALIYIVCQTNKEILAGHFVPAEMHTTPNLNNFNVDPDILPKFLKTVSKPGILDSFSHYQSMMAYVKYLTDTYGKDSVEAYIFGQHFLTTKPQGITSKLLDRLNLDADLTQQGFRRDNILDFRDLEIYQKPGDNTLYLPDKKTIYLQRFT